MVQTSATKNEKEIKSSLIVKLMIGEVFLFLVALFLTVFSSYRIRWLFQRYAFLPQPLTVRQIVFYFLVATLIIVLITLLRSKKVKSTALKLIFVLAIFSGELIFLSLWISPSLATLLSVILIWVWLFFPIVLIHNICVFLAVVGAASRVGIEVTPETVIVVMSLFSIYDWLAVYKSGHMIRIAKAMLKERSILGIVFPFKIKNLFQKIDKDSSPKKFIVVGAGDMVLPLLLSASFVASGIIPAFLAGFFSLIGVLTSLFVFLRQKTLKPIPALPLITIFSLIGFVINKII